MTAVTASEATMSFTPPSLRCFRRRALRVYPREVRTRAALVSIPLALTIACGAPPASHGDPLVIAPPTELTRAPSFPAMTASEVRRVGGRKTSRSIAVIHTSLGRITCKLFGDRAPLTVDNFVGLATGTKRWKDPTTGDWVERPAYDESSFHRVIPGFIIQGGDPKGDGTGEPGFEFEDELWEGATHDRAGLLCMANRGKNTNGMQFFITDGPSPQLDKSYTIFGECKELELIHAIASVPRDNDKPRTKVEIRSIRIE